MLAELCSSRKMVQSTKSHPHNILIYRDCVGRRSHPASQVSAPPREGRTHNLWIKNTNSHTCCEAHMSMCRAEARMDVGTLRRSPRHNIWNLDERTLGKPKGSRTKESVSLAEHMFSHNALPGRIITMMNP